jgi:hypothetical protein
MHRFRTVLEQKIRERKQTLEEFAEHAETFAREHNEPGTISVRHLQRLASGQGRKGQPLGPLRPATARLLERIFDQSIEELLAPPAQPESTDAARHAPGRYDKTTDGAPRTSSDRRNGASSQGDGERNAVELAMAFEWLDDRAGWIPDTTRRKVEARLAKSDTRELLDRHARRARVPRSLASRALSDYYTDRIDGYEPYRVRLGNHTLTTTILTRSDWLGLACPLGQGEDRLTLVKAQPAVTRDTIRAQSAVHRLTEAAAFGVRIANVPLYRLLDFNTSDGTITGSVSSAPFVEYALTMDLLESELADSIMANRHTRPGDLPLRDRYLPDLRSVLDLPQRLCVGGALALCAIARPYDPARGTADYALLIQRRSGHVLNAARRLAVIPKGFHQPMTDLRADAEIGATLRREMEEELFGRGEVDSTAGPYRAAAPMHPERLSEPMRWLLEDPSRLRMECTGFGLNLISGNYEFGSLVVIEDEEFWPRYGGQVETNWESAGLSLYSSRDTELLSEMISDEAWSNEGLFALLQGLRRLADVGEGRVNLPKLTLPMASEQ